MFINESYRVACYNGNIYPTNPTGLVGYTKIHTAAKSDKNNPVANYC